MSRGGRSDGALRDPKTPGSAGIKGLASGSQRRGWALEGASFRVRQALASPWLPFCASTEGPPKQNRVEALFGWQPPLSSPRSPGNGGPVVPDPASPPSFEASRAAQAGARSTSAEQTNPRVSTDLDGGQRRCHPVPRGPWGRRAGDPLAEILYCVYPACSQGEP
jgi:hypothetical protein